jgi:hypothetical protein
VRISNADAGGTLTVLPSTSYVVLMCHDPSLCNGPPPNVTPVVDDRF